MLLEIKLTNKGLMMYDIHAKVWHHLIASEGETIYIKEELKLSYEQPKLINPVKIESLLLKYQRIIQEKKRNAVAII